MHGRAPLELHLRRVWGSDGFIGEHCLVAGVDPARADGEAGLFTIVCNESNF